MRVMVGEVEPGRLAFLNRENAETRLWVGGAMEPSSWVSRFSAACLRTSGLAPFLAFDVPDPAGFFALTDLFSAAAS